MMVAGIAIIVVSGDNLLVVPNGTITIPVQTSIDIAAGVNGQDSSIHWVANLTSMEEPVELGACQKVDRFSVAPRFADSVTLTRNFGAQNDCSVTISGASFDHHDGHYWTETRVRSFPDFTARVVNTSVPTRLYVTGEFLRAYQKQIQESTIII